jgi:hypothetical protein
MSASPHERGQGGSGMPDTQARAPTNAEAPRRHPSPDAEDYSDDTADQ